MITEIIMNFLVAAKKIDEKIAPKMYSDHSYLTININCFNNINHHYILQDTGTRHCITRMGSWKYQ